MLQEARSLDLQGFKANKLQSPAWTRESRILSVVCLASLHACPRLLLKSRMRGLSAKTGLRECLKYFQRNQLCVCSWESMSWISGKAQKESIFPLGYPQEDIHRPGNT